MKRAVLATLLVIIFLIVTKKIINLFFSTEKKVEKPYEKPIVKKMQMCEKCAVGKANYEIDEHSEVCPFLGGRDGGECGFFKPLEK